MPKLNTQSRSKKTFTIEKYVFFHHKQNNENLVLYLHRVHRLAAPLIELLPFITQISTKRLLRNSVAKFRISLEAKCFLMFTTNVDK